MVAGSAGVVAPRPRLGVLARQERPRSTPLVPSRSMAMGHPVEPAQKEKWSAQMSDPKKRPPIRDYVVPISMDSLAKGRVDFSKSYVSAEYVDHQAKRLADLVETLLARPPLLSHERAKPAALHEEAGGRGSPPVYEQGGGIDG